MQVHVEGEDDGGLVRHAGGGGRGQSCQGERVSHARAVGKGAGVASSHTRVVMGGGGGGRGGGGGGAVGGVGGGGGGGSAMARLAPAIHAPHIDSM